MRSHIFSAEYSIHIFVTLCSIWYVALPLLIYQFFLPIDFLMDLAQISAFGLLASVLGWRIRVFPVKQGLPTFVHTGSTFHYLLWIFFSVFFLITISTASSVPLFDSFAGADPNQLSEGRGAFLKGREGYLSSLLFINTILVTGFIPYSLACLYCTNRKIFLVAMLLFLFYCISYLVKALFLTAMIPVLYVYFTLHGARLGQYLKVVVVVVFGLTTMAFLSGGAGDTGKIETASSVSGYFAANYRPSDSLDFVIWRAVAIPIITAGDTLKVHAQQYSGAPLMGRTNGLISFLFGMERVKMEKEVHAEQYGGFNETANANAFFLTEGYINFGMAGVIAFGVLAGLTLRFFKDSKNIAFSAIWPLYAIGLFNASMFSMMFGSGFLLFFAYARVYEQKRVRRFRKSQKQARLNLAGEKS